MLFIRDLSKSCGMEVYRVEKSNVWKGAALRTPKWANDDSKFVGFLSIHILLTPVWLVFTLQYFSSSVFNQSFHAIPFTYDYNIVWSFICWYENILTY